MKMRKTEKIRKRIMLAICLCLVSLLAINCNKAEKKSENNAQMTDSKKNEKYKSQEKYKLGNVEYSHLNSEKSGEEIYEALKKAGIKSDYINVLKNHVNQFNSLSSEKNRLIGDFINTDNFNPVYDPYALQDLWKEKYPDFLGYNCRITSFGLFKDYLDIDTSVEKRDELLFLDFEALESDNSAVMTKNELEKFKVIFSYIPTENTKNVDIHVKNIKDDWKSRKIRFKDNPNVRMISIFFHDNIDAENKLFIGHIGILVKGENQKFYFIEKIAFQEPYQVTIFKNESELYNFLMKRYDVDENQETAKPIIFNNDEVLQS